MLFSKSSLPYHTILLHLHNNHFFHVMRCVITNEGTKLLIHLSLETMLQILPSTFLKELFDHVI